MEKEMILDGISIRVNEIHMGHNRPVIVFLHDSLGAIALWRDFPEQLAQRTQYNVLVYDRQGYGRSGPFTTFKRANHYLETEADTLIRLLDASGISRAILFGHSDGGSIALIAAAKYPDRIQAIITEGAHIFVEEITLAGIRDAVTAWQHTNLRSKLEKYHGHNTEAVFHAWTDTWLHPQFRSWNIEHFLPLIKCPVLVIQGEKDEFGSMAQVNGIMEKVSGTAEKLIVADAGHCPHKESGQIVLGSTATFISTHFRA